MSTNQEPVAWMSYWDGKIPNPPHFSRSSGPLLGYRKPVPLYTHPQQDEIERLRGFADLWYFVMDEAPREFERIVAEHSPKQWMQEAAKLRAAARAKAAQP